MEDKIADISIGYIQADFCGSGVGHGHTNRWAVCVDNFVDRTVRNRCYRFNSPCNYCYEEEIMSSIIVTPAMLFSGITVVGAIALAGILWHNHRQHKKDAAEKQ